MIVLMMALLSARNFIYRGRRVMSRAHTLLFQGIPGRPRLCRRSRAAHLYVKMSPALRPNQTTPFFVRSSFSHASHMLSHPSCTDGGANEIMKVLISRSI